jgi:hypothetical protein
LNALTLRRRDFLPVQRCFQFPDLFFSALDHPFPPKHDSQERIILRSSAPQKKQRKLQRFQRLKAIQVATEAV